jgi:hypothetical protein
VTCALRQYVPLVVLSEDEPDPFADWRVARADLDDLIEQVEGAVRAELPRHAARVTADLRRHLPIEAAGARAEVRRDGRRALVTLVLPSSVDDATAEAMAVRAAGVVRKIDRWTGIVDVNIEREDQP